MYNVQYEADVYYHAAVMSVNNNRSLAESQISSYMEGIVEDGLSEAKYEDVVDFTNKVVVMFVEKHKHDFPDQNWDIHDEKSISWFLIMLSIAFFRTTNGKIDVKKLFKDVFIRHFSNL